MSGFGDLALNETMIVRLKAEIDMLKIELRASQDDRKYLTGKIEQAQNDIDGLTGIIIKGLRSKPEAV